MVKPAVGSTTQIVAKVSADAAVRSGNSGTCKPMLAGQFGGTLILAGGKCAFPFILDGRGQVSPPLLAAHRSHVPACPRPLQTIILEPR